MIDFSKKRLARASDEKVDIRQLAVAELMAWGWDAVDAMLAVGVIRESDTKIDAQHAAINFTATDEFEKLRKKRASQLRNGTVLDEYQKLHPTPGTAMSNRGCKRTDGITRKKWEGDTPEPVSDEELLAAIWATIEKLDVADPKRVDLLDKYDKLKRRQGDGDDKSTIHFYLPRPECDNCPFRGNHIITEPSQVEPQPEEDEDEEEPIAAEPKPGYSVNGKKLGRPRKKRWAVKGRARKQMLAEKAQAEEEERARQEALELTEPIDIFEFEEEL